MVGSFLSEAPPGETDWRRVAAHSQQLASRRRDRIAHGHSSTVATMELEAGHKPSVGESLQAALGRRSGAPLVEASVYLAAEHVSQ